MPQSRDQAGTRASGSPLQFAVPPQREHKARKLKEVETSCVTSELEIEQDSGLASMGAG